MRLPESYWRHEAALLQNELEPVLTAAALAAARSAIPGQRKAPSIGIDWSLINRQVREWAHRYTYELVNGITATTKLATQAAIATWIESGNPLDDLFTALKPVFGRQRAQVVAVTEVTRVYAEGNRATWKNIGASGMTWMTVVDELVCDICGELAGKTADIDKEFAEGNFAGIPPAHPNCRCYLQPQIKLPGE